MLHYETIDTATNELLKNLMSVPFFGDLRLVGGTALALKIGHRKSIDLDLFGIHNASDLEIANILNQFGTVQIINQGRVVKVYQVNNIKVDIVLYSYPWLKEKNIIDDIRLADFEDIAAMKLAAIAGRGTKKDFIDLFFLLQKFSLAEMIQFYNKKYSDGSELMVARSLSYFDDAESDPMPIMLENIKWDEVKSEISKQVKKYFKL